MNRRCTVFIAAALMSLGTGFASAQSAGSVNGVRVKI
jgi:hypothetical protein